MRISSIIIRNFRQLKLAKLDLEDQQTLIVGANNSGKTSAMQAMIKFFGGHRLEGKGSGASSFHYNDLSTIIRPNLQSIGVSWESRNEIDDIEFLKLLPSLDLWLHIEETETSLVAAVLPKLDWQGPNLGVRLRLEPKKREKDTETDTQALANDYRAAREKAEKRDKAARKASEEKAQENGEAPYNRPKNLLEFLEDANNLAKYFEIAVYALDVDDEEDSEPKFQPEARLESNSLRDLIYVSYQSPDGRDGKGKDDSTNGRQQSMDSEFSKVFEAKTGDDLDDVDKYAENLPILRALKAADQSYEEASNKLLEAEKEVLEDLGYPGVNDSQLSFSTDPTIPREYPSRMRVNFQQKELENTALPETSQGFGYRRLILLTLDLLAKRAKWLAPLTKENDPRPVPPLHLMLIEEPEAHLHAPVQKVFIDKAFDVLSGAREKGELGRDKTTQLIVSTHATHIANAAPFNTLRYFKRKSKEGFIQSSIVNLAGIEDTGEESLRFAKNYIRLTHCDLLFADAAILVEGKAEGLLLPYFIKRDERFNPLQSRFLCQLEIGGNYMHRLQGFLEALGIPVLMITDLDTVVTVGGRGVAPKSGDGQKTSNNTLKQLHPELDDLDQLLKADPKKDDSLYVAFQKEVSISFEGETKTLIPRTFEDALLYANVEGFGTFKLGLGKNLHTALNDNKSKGTDDIHRAVFEALKGGKKGNLALDIAMEMELQDLTLKTPEYIAKGLEWLGDRFNKPDVPDDSGAKSAKVSS